VRNDIGVRHRKPRASRDIRGYAGPRSACPREIGRRADRAVVSSDQNKRFSPNLRGRDGARTALAIFRRGDKMVVRAPGATIKFSAKAARLSEIEFFRRGKVSERCGPQFEPLEKNVPVYRTFRGSGNSEPVRAPRTVAGEDGRPASASRLGDGCSPGSTTPLLQRGRSPWHPR